MRRTKLIATLGPATDGPGVLDALVAAGLDVARLNSSHADRAQLERQLAAVRAAADRAERHVAVMLDLGGAKLRARGRGSRHGAGSRPGIRRSGVRRRPGDATGAQREPRRPGGRCGRG